MNWLDRFRNKLDPLVSPKEQAAREIVGIVNKWSARDQDEILRTVVKRVYSQPTHLHRNPRKREQAAA